MIDSPASEKLPHCMRRMPHVVFAGGGTGGHLFPGLAVAAELIAHLPQARITFVGSGKEFERRHTAAAGFEYIALPCRPRPRRLAEFFSFFVDNLAGYLAAGRFLDGHAVSAVVGLGGYASVPMGTAAARRGVPLVLLEQNAVLGRANRWLAASAETVCASFAEAVLPWRYRCPVHVTGNPIRRQCIRHTPCAGYDKLLLILGGSSGARTLNENVPRALGEIRAALADWRIVHQSGDADLEATRDLYRRLGVEATVEPFLADLPARLAAARLAICRAGGTTLAELAAAGVPAVIVPYPHAAENHQRRNAEAFVHIGGAVLVDEREWRGRLVRRLVEVLSPLLGDAVELARRAAYMRSSARPDAAATVAAIIEQACRKKESSG